MKKKTLIICFNLAEVTELSNQFLAAGFDIFLSSEKSTFNGEILASELKLDYRSPSIFFPLEELDQNFIKSLKVDVFVYSDRILAPKDFSSISSEQWHDQVIKPLKELQNITKSVIQGMIKQKWGRIIFVTAGVGACGEKNLSELSTLSAARFGFCKSLSRELLHYGITVNSIATGIRNEKDLSPNLENSEELRYTGIRRFTTAKDIANTTIFLASENSDHITGQTLHVNGGLLV